MESSVCREGAWVELAAKVTCVERHSKPDARIKKKREAVGFSIRLFLLYRKLFRISYIIKFYAQLRARNKSCAFRLFCRKSDWKIDQIHKIN